MVAGGVKEVWRFSFGLGKFQMVATRCLEEVSYWQLHLRVWISSERYRREITELGDNNRQGGRNGYLITAGSH